jgi:hypothetical protein
MSRRSPSKKPKYILSPVDVRKANSGFFARTLMTNDAQRDPLKVQFTSYRLALALLNGVVPLPTAEQTLIVLEKTYQQQILQCRVELVSFAKHVMETPTLLISGDEAISAEDFKHYLKKAIAIICNAIEGRQDDTALQHIEKALKAADYPRIRFDVLKEYIGKIRNNFGLDPSVKPVVDEQSLADLETLQRNAFYIAIRNQTQAIIGAASAPQPLQDQLNTMFTKLDGESQQAYEAYEKAGADVQDQTWQTLVQWVQAHPSMQSTIPGADTVLSGGDASDDDGAAKAKLVAKDDLMSPDGRPTTSTAQPTPYHRRSVVASSAAYDIAINSRFNANDQDKHGNTLLHYALESGNVIFVGMLLRMGARMDIRNKYGKTPLQMKHGRLLLSFVDNAEYMRAWYTQLLDEAATLPNFLTAEIHNGTHEAEDASDQGALIEQKKQRCLAEFEDFIKTCPFTGNNALHWAVVHAQLGSFNAFHRFAEHPPVISHLILSSATEEPTATPAPMPTTPATPATRIERATPILTLDEIWAHKNAKGLTPMTVKGKDTEKNVVSLVTEGVLGDEQQHVELVDKVWARAHGDHATSVDDEKQPDSVPESKGLAPTRLFVSPQPASRQTLTLRVATQHDDAELPKLQETVLRKDDNDEYTLARAVRRAKQEFDEFCLVKQRAEVVEVLFRDTLDHIHQQLKNVYDDPTGDDHDSLMQKLTAVHTMMLDLINGKEKQAWIADAESKRTETIASRSVFEPRNSSGKCLFFCAPQRCKVDTVENLEKINFGGKVDVNGELPKPENLFVKLDSHSTLHAAIRSFDVGVINAACREMSTMSNLVSPELLFSPQSSVQQSQSDSSSVKKYTPAQYVVAFTERCRREKETFLVRVKEYKRVFTLLEGYLIAELDSNGFFAKFKDKVLLKRKVDLVHLVRRKVLSGEINTLKDAIDLLKTATDEKGTIAAADKTALMASKRNWFDIFGETQSMSLIRGIERHTSEVAEQLIAAPAAAA